MKTFLRIIIYSGLLIITAAMLWLMNLDIDLYDTKITPETIQLFNPSNGKFLFLKSWRMIKSWNVERNLGKVEREAHRLLAKYKVDGKTYNYSYERRNALELFECSIQDALDAVIQAMKTAM